MRTDNTDFTWRIFDESPTIDEYSRLIASVEWKPRDVEAVEIALRSSCFDVTARVGEEAVGMGRIVGDGALHFFLCDVVVDPRFQKRGIGRAIVQRLDEWVRARPYPNTLVSLTARLGTEKLYGSVGYRDFGDRALMKWINGKGSVSTAERGCADTQKEGT